MRWMLFSSLVFLLISGCKQKALTADEMEEYVLDKSNHLVSEIEDGPINLQLVFRPASLIAWQELESDTGIDASTIDSLNIKYKNNIYFILNISKSGEEILGHVSGSFKSDLNTLAFGMTEHVRLVTSTNDTIALSGYSYPRMFGISNQTSVLMAFQYDKLDACEWICVVVEDGGLGIGNRKFRFLTKDILEIPQLDYKTS